MKKFKKKNNDKIKKKILSKKNTKTKSKTFKMILYKIMKLQMTMKLNILRKKLVGGLKK